MKRYDILAALHVVALPEPYELEVKGSQFRVRHYGPDNATGTDDQWWYGPWWSTRDLNVDGLRRQVLRAVLAYAEHEVREQFFVAGETIFANTH